jgi:hypothetical protein
MSTATDELVDLDVDLDSEVPCDLAGLADKPIMAGPNFPAGGFLAGACDGEGVAWVWLTACCGAQYFVCHGHYLRWHEGAARIRTPERVQHGVKCGALRNIRNDRWVRI